MWGFTHTSTLPRARWPCRYRGYTKSAPTNSKSRVISQVEFSEDRIACGTVNHTAVNYSEKDYSELREMKFDLHPKRRREKF
ncbi:hypothetical protein AVEN_21260-1 [Araneus ventricosus]|uniref:Uncharacterized protein n=1 Tax=Araneus ventricosus TaxID=182803 RepID=A0A4Y2NYD4_ARAVE|nr:hypothetical protein AVEN_21260-1 [Araneus ventricosus]